MWHVIEAGTLGFMGRPRVAGLMMLRAPVEAVLAQSGKLGEAMANAMVNYLSAAIEVVERAAPP